MADFNSFTNVTTFIILTRRIVMPLILPSEVVCLWSCHVKGRITQTVPSLDWVRVWVTDNNVQWLKCMRYIKIGQVFFVCLWFVCLFVLWFFIIINYVVKCLNAVVLCNRFLMEKSKVLYSFISLAVVRTSCILQICYNKYPTIKQAFLAVYVYMQTGCLCL